MNRSEKAYEFFKQGYNCSQSVVLAFSDLIDIPNDKLLKMSSSFGGGMGRMREVCGAVSGMFIVAGFLYGYDLPQDKTSKANHYARIQELAKKFISNHNTIICRNLLPQSETSTNPVPSERTEAYYTKRSCADLVFECAKILDDYIKENPCKL